MQRLAETTPTDDQRERLKRIARRVDTWSETRTNKTLYESWMGTCALLPQLYRRGRA